MKYCKRCTMPDTRPGITFDAEGVCSACRHYEHRKLVDWDARWKEFEALCYLTLCFIGFQLGIVLYFLVQVIEGFVGDVIL